MKLIHYTNKKIHSLDDREYKQEDINWQAKPNGFWVSVECLGQKKDYNWKEWCECEKYLLDSLSISYEIKLKKESKILHLKTKEDVFEFTKKYPLKTTFSENDTHQLNWKDVKSNYQGIIISPYQWDCRLSQKSCWYYGWDCSSGCLWDLKCIQEFILLSRMEKVHH